MGVFAVGDVVLIPFPYADFSTFKKRPALVVGIAEFDNLILCQITSKAITSKKAIKLVAADFLKGSLNIESYIRPDKLFTVEKSVIEGVLGSLKTETVEVVQSAIRQLFT